LLIAKISGCSSNNFSTNAPSSEIGVVLGLTRRLHLTTFLFATVSSTASIVKSRPSEMSV
jgi:hypothetical protein